MNRQDRTAKLKIIQNRMGRIFNIAQGARSSTDWVFLAGELSDVETLEILNEVAPYLAYDDDAASGDPRAWQERLGDLIRDLVGHPSGMRTRRHPSIRSIPTRPYHPPDENPPRDPYMVSPLFYRHQDRVAQVSRHHGPEGRWHAVFMIHRGHRVEEVGWLAFSSRVRAALAARVWVADGEMPPDVQPPAYSAMSPRRNPALRPERIGRERDPQVTCPSCGERVYPDDECPLCGWELWIDAGDREQLSEVIDDE